jgi:peptidyl-prolyl cis-trans isomerase A (cyclophilin A)
MDLVPRSSGFSVRFGITMPPPVPDIYKVLVKKVDYRQDFEEAGKKSSRKLGQLHKGELIEGLPGAECKRVDSKGVEWVHFAKPDFGRQGVGWAPVTDKKKRVLELEPPPKVYGEMGGDQFEFGVDVHPTWAPLAAQRFRELCEAQFFIGCRFFRVVPGFVVQWGINGTPGATEEWPDLPDEPREQQNLAGTLAFANSGPGTRSTQLFVNYSDAMSLDEREFVPFAEIAENDMEVVENIFSGYGEDPDQGCIRAEGNDYLRTAFPQLSFIHSCEIVEQAGSGSPSAEPLERIWSPRMDRYTGKPYVENIYTGERRDAPPDESEQQAAAKSPQAGAATAAHGESQPDFGDFSTFEADGQDGAAAGFEANFEESEDPPPSGGAAAGGYDFGDYGGVSLEDAMGGGWSDEDDDDQQGYSGFRGGGETTATKVEESVPPSSAVTWTRTGGDSEPEPAVAPGFDWSGLWSCCYAPKSTRTFDKIRMRQDGDRIIGVKAEGDSCLGQNWVLLEALLAPGATSGRGRRLMYAKSPDGKSVRKP